MPQQSLPSTREEVHPTVRHTDAKRTPLYHLRPNEANPSRRQLRQETWGNDQYGRTHRVGSGSPKRVVYASAAYYPQLGLTQQGGQLGYEDTGSDNGESGHGRSYSQPVAYPVAYPGEGGVQDVGYYRRRPSYPPQVGHPRYSVHSEDPRNSPGEDEDQQIAEYVKKIKSQLSDRSDESSSRSSENRRSKHRSSRRRSRRRKTRKTRADSDESRVASHEVGKSLKYKTAAVKDSRSIAARGRRRRSRSRRSRSRKGFSVPEELASVRAAMSGTRSNQQDMADSPTAASEPLPTVGVAAVTTVTTSSSRPAITLTDQTTSKDVESQIPTRRFQKIIRSIIENMVEASLANHIPLGSASERPVPTLVPRTFGPSVPPVMITTQKSKPTEKPEVSAMDVLSELRKLRASIQNDFDAITKKLQGARRAMDFANPYMREIFPGMMPQVGVPPVEHQVNNDNRAGHGDQPTYYHAGSATSNTAGEGFQKVSLASPDGGKPSSRKATSPKKNPLLSNWLSQFLQ